MFETVVNMCYTYCMYMSPFILCQSKLKTGLDALKLVLL